MNESRTTWLPRIEDGIHLPLSFAECSMPALNMVGGLAGEKELSCGRLIGYLAPVSTPWKTCSLTVIGAKLPSGRWDIQKSSAMLAIEVRALQFQNIAGQYRPYTLYAVIINTPNGPAPPLITGTFGSADFIHSLMGEATE